MAITPARAGTRPTRHPGLILRSGPRRIAIQVRRFARRSNPSAAIYRAIQIANPSTSTSNATVTPIAHWPFRAIARALASKCWPAK